jgi:hypothetical protein
MLADRRLGLGLEPIPTISNFSLTLSTLDKRTQNKCEAPGYEDDVVNDEILEFLPVDELLVQAFPLVLRSGDVWGKNPWKISEMFKNVVFIYLAAQTFVFFGGGELLSLLTKSALQHYHIL